MIIVLKIPRNEEYGMRSTHPPFIFCYFSQIYVFFHFHLAKIRSICYNAIIQLAEHNFNGGYAKKRPFLAQSDFNERNLLILL